jgi:drug/metabolite transporter (DMT)-like permease
LAADTAQLLADRRILRAIGLAVLAFGCFGVLDVSAKYLGSVGLPALLVIWFRYAGHVVFALATLRRANVVSVWRANRPRLQLLRGLFLFSATCCNFIAVRYLQLDQTGAINFAIPLLVAALSVPVLGERVGPRRWAAIVVGFTGVLVIVRPTPDLFQPVMLLSLTSACFAAAYALTTRLVAQADDHETSNAYAALVGTALTTPLIPFVWQTPEGIAWLPVVLVGSFGAVGHYLLVAAHQHAPAPVLAPFWYVQILPMIVLGFLVFGDVPDALTLLGAGVVLASGLYVWWRERLRKRDLGA